jgi:selenide,water dikinase
LAQVLRHVPEVSDPNVLVAALTRDDAAVYRLTDDRAIVATVDFFTPIVDDPYAFGAIAAANAFSDVYAMGARPLLALNIVAWPRDPDVAALLGDVVRGAVDVAREAGAFILGGHSIDDPEPKFGMVAIGEVHPDEVLTNAGARPGDVLVLTKPVGTGILSTALKRGMIGEDEMRSAIRSMTTLNAGALRAARAVGKAVHAVTDVTGFGLLGHLFNVLEASGVGARLVARRVPPFEGVLDLIGRRAVPGGTERNVDAAAAFTTWNAGVDDPTRILLCDAQTSGGLLMAVDPASVEELVDHLVACGTPAAAVIGEIVAGPPAVRVVANAGR